MKIVCFDIGGTKILKAVVWLEGGKYKFLEMREEKNPRKEKRIKEILQTYRDYAGTKYKTKKAALSAACIVNPVKKTISGGKMCYGKDSFSWRFLEEAEFSVRAENDGRCFALGEYNFGKGKGKKSVLALTLGTGIGGGFVLEGKNYRGAHFSALEVGRSEIYFAEKWHGWEWVAAGRGIEKFYSDFSGKKIAAREVFAKAAKGEGTAGKVIAQAQKVLGVGIANLLNTLDPEILVIGGGMAEQKKFVSGALKTAKENVLNKYANYKFAISDLGNKANLLGAASLYF